MHFDAVYMMRYEVCFVVRNAYSFLPRDAVAKSLPIFSYPHSWLFDSTLIEMTTHTRKLFVRNDQWHYQNQHIAKIG